MTPAEFRTNRPNVYFLDPAQPDRLAEFLTVAGVLLDGEAIESSARAGDGNMNCTVRVTTPRRSFIVKQSRPWVEKYPQFAAPWDRACREAEFYQRVAGHEDVASMMPALIHCDPAARVLVLEDLGTARDYTGLYRGETIAQSEVGSLATFLSALHGAFPTDAARPLPNREMRQLNHAHLFQIPLAAHNGLDLDAITDGLAGVAAELKSDTRYCREVERLGRDVYLADGPCLLHGDFFPGSLIRTPAGPRVIDPEFGFFGRPEFDVAVLTAHLLLAHQPPAHRSHLRRAYRAPAGFDDALMLQLAGVEIMRRLIGYAQLPVGYGLERKRDLLERSRRLVLEPSTELLAVP
jgi:5-methylthioribose kinase